MHGLDRCRRRVIVAAAHPRHAVAAAARPSRAVAAAAGVLVAVAGCSSAAPPPAAPAAAAPRPATASSTPTPTKGDDCGLRRTGPPDAIEGWLSAESISPGDPVALHVSTTARSYTATVFRTGGYSGSGCRLVLRSATLTGHRRSPAVVKEPLHTATAPWPTDLSLPTTSWTPGDYLVRLDAAGGDQRYVPLTVRSPSARGRVVILNAVTTWQAYNAWGGYSLYHGPTGFADRARAVSFDRPYDYGDGAADFTGNEWPLVTLAEQLKLPLAYATDIDLHADPHLLDGARAVISLGHDEYYSPAMRHALEQARDHGTNVAFLGANAVFRRIRLGPTATGPRRLETDYKDSGEDPLGDDPKQVTANWPSPPYPNPESSLTGGMYQCNPVHAAMVVRLPSHWLLAGTGVKAGDRLPGLVGSEYDRIDLNRRTPHLIEALTHSPLTCNGVPDSADVTYYTAPSGAGVFDAGTSGWICVVNDVCGPGGSGMPARAFVRRVTTNLLQAFATGPAGRLHPGARSVPASAASAPEVGDTER